MSAQSPDKEVESCRGEDEEVMVFSTLRDRYQIPDNIPIRLLGKFEKCYLGKTADVGMYNAMFVAGLRLPLTALHRQLANFLGFSVSQITPNAWSIFIGVEILWGCLSGGNRQLTLNEFFWCYRPQHITSSQGIYHFSARKKGLRLVSDMPDSNRNSKGSVHPHITDEQEAFIRRVKEILLDERRCWYLITLDTLHLYCRGLELTPVAHKLNAYSRRREHPLIKDPCDGEKTEELGASGLFDVARVKFLYPHLDLSKATMDDIPPSTPTSDIV
ncbi:hypothetical protein SO802_001095 [Lithocarpus litseifolius]|uniref:Uncharacterized protein n=1 Tax=Lithocarpus litseifolius TaxID=425828 RepID=A0AAW2DYL8_9ROSI